MDISKNLVVAISDIDGAPNFPKTCPGCESEILSADVKTDSYNMFFHKQKEQLPYQRAISPLGEVLAIANELDTEFKDDPHVYSRIVFSCGCSFEFRGFGSLEGKRLIPGKWLSTVNCVTPSVKVVEKMLEEMKINQSGHMFNGKFLTADYCNNK